MIKNKSLFLVLLLLVVNNLAAQTSDSLRSTPAADKKIADAIFQSDSMNITVRVRGCFTGYTTTLCIYRSGKNIQLDYTKGNAADNRHMIISKRQLYRIRQLFYKGIDLPKDRAMCTTKSTFVATAKGKTVRFIDGRCSDTDDLAEQLDKILNVSPEE
ncbi:MAG: hypothetical protein JWP12_2096 [Bacteroidetes bacterium]|nr:hypothetical protein [Bacteroidota bacterium]